MGVILMGIQKMNTTHHPPPPAKAAQESAFKYISSP